MPGFNLAEYEPVEDRLAKFWADHPNGRVWTDRVKTEDPAEFIFLAEVYRDSSDDEPAATGWAQEFAGSSPVNRTSALENCETSAIGRALANLGYAPKGKRPSREEMTKASAGSTAATARTSHADRKPATGTSEPGPAESSPGGSSGGGMPPTSGEHRSGEGGTKAYGEGAEVPSSSDKPVIVEDRFVTENEMAELVKLTRSPARLVAMSRRMFPDTDVKTPADLKLSHYHSIRQAVQRGEIP